MSDSVTNTTLSEVQKGVHTIHLTNISDSTGEAAVIKVNVSDLEGPDSATAPTSVTIMEATWDVQGFTSIQILWDATTDDVACVMTGHGYNDWSAVGGLEDPKSSGTTGDIKLTTIGATASSTYDITLVCKLEV